MHYLRNHRIYLLPAAIIFLAGGSWSLDPARAAESVTPTPTADYRLTFNSTWSQTTHPPALTPEAPHFSGLIGGTHDERVEFWAPGAPASPGIERMSEEGSKMPLDLEVIRAIQAGVAGGVISGGGIGRSPGRAAAAFTVSMEFPLVTVVSMIAPSPDWFVGVRNLNMFEGGDWIEAIEIDLFAYDAGTDDGEFWNSADADSQPHQAIRPLISEAFPEGLRLGTFTFTRTDSPNPPVPFLRGDCNGDGSSIGITDAITLLSHNFIAELPLPCPAACDVNADGGIEGVADALALLIHNFLGQGSIPAPFPSCGRSGLGTDAELGCGAAPASCR